MNNSELLKELRIDRSAPPPAPARTGLWIGLGVGGAVLALALLGWAVFGGDDAIEVKTADVTSADSGGGSASVLDATGYVVARRMATVSAKITGKVREVLIEEGQRVEAGQVMATLDPIDADAQRELAASQLAATRSEIAAVQAQLKEAEANASRLSGLAQQQLVSKAQFDVAIAQRDALRARLQTAQRNAQVAGSGLRIAAQGVDNTIVRAPFAGIVIAKAAQPGEIVSPLSAGGGFTRTGIGTIVDMDSLEVEVDVAEAYIGRVQPKMPVEAVLNAYPDWRIPAEVIAIIPTADRAKATVKVRIALKAKDARIVPDMGVRVSFLEQDQKAAAAATAAPRALVPAGALRRDGDQDVVFVLREGKAERRAVKLGGNIGDSRQVLAGVSAGERVITEAPASLQDGADVEVAEAK
ncbi:efflux RND transporter periplasmic adaptor subunit [Lysobacter solisilvae (ex Woo and Kim 2020)]|uniref:Efflux RND transporter periplasmic adaptor subunit n=1 Tax=Agrilutibacter terrestris TaxID=2865112 RepID=A0A7H0FUJ6_9GAMM|nr:efflux RND transporter periplasmic adaptor subunit [Lysobacter terrestris]QNP39712.1 efflux RND transporter periplasmic adaptor subunit [Lysobacter terrestris]